MALLRCQVETDRVTLLLAGLSGTQLVKARVKIGELMVKRTRDRIRRRVDPDGKAWPARKNPERSRQGRGIRLADSILYKLTNDGVTIESSHHAIRFLQFGTRAYIIRPRFKKALYWEGARHPVAKVRHPGIKARTVLGIGESDVDAIRELVLKTLLTGTI